MQDLHGLPLPDAVDAAEAVMRRGYDWRRILRRTLHTARRRRSLDVAMGSFFTQLAFRKDIPQLFQQARGRL